MYINKYLKYKTKYLQLKNFNGGECQPVPDLEDIEYISRDKYGSRTSDNRITLNNKCYFVYELYQWIKENGSDPISRTPLSDNETTRINEAYYSIYGDPTKLIIPDDVSTIENNQYKQKGLTSVKISSSIINIGTQAFCQNNLNSLEFILPSKLKIIGSASFASNKLSNIIIPHTVSVIHEAAFYKNELQTLEFVLPSLLTSISKGTFMLNKLTSIKIPNSIVIIGEQAFMYNELTSIEIPNSVINIDHRAFAKNKLTIVNIPNSVITIGNRAFANNELTIVKIPNSVITIGNEAFWYNPITTVSIPRRFEESINIYFLNTNNIIFSYT